MMFNERDVRQNGIVGKMERLSFIGAKVFGNCSGWQFFVKSPRNAQSKVVVEGDKAAIESGIMQPRKAQAVSDIQPVLGVRGPRQDMRRHE
jgi:hypothetical protein